MSFYFCLATRDKRQRRIRFERGLHEFHFPVSIVPQHRKKVKCYFLGSLKAFEQQWGCSVTCVIGFGLLIVFLLRLLGFVRQHWEPAAVGNCCRGNWGGYASFGSSSETSWGPHLRLFEKSLTELEPEVDFPPAHNVTTGSSCPGLGARCVLLGRSTAAHSMCRLYLLQLLSHWDIQVSFSLQRLVLCQALPRHNFKEL